MINVLISSANFFRLDVWSEMQVHGAEVIQLRTWNSAFDNGVLDWSQSPVGIYAQVTQNRRPVHGAQVTAAVYVTDANGLSILSEEIPLKDEGLAGRCYIDVHLSIEMPGFY